MDLDVCKGEWPLFRCALVFQLLPDGIAGDR
jgi:hypothetical protein